MHPGEFALGIGFGEQRLQDLLPGAILLPAHQPVMTTAAGRIARRQVLPRRARALDPEDPIQHFAVRSVRAAPLARAFGRQEGLQSLPLSVG
jgi:hypothetical protein